jgi:hypothetical protein
MMMKVQIDTEAGSRALADGTLTRVMEEAMGRLRPEAAYFGPDHGCRTAFIVFDLEDPSQLPVLTEPLFGSMKASVDVFPVMNREDLQKGLAGVNGGA